MIISVVSIIPALCLFIYSLPLSGQKQMAEGFSVGFYPLYYRSASVRLGVCQCDVRVLKKAASCSKAFSPTEEK